MARTQKKKKNQNGKHRSQLAKKEGEGTNCKIERKGPLKAISLCFGEESPCGNGATGGERAKRGDSALDGKWGVNGKSRGSS